MPGPFSSLYGGSAMGGVINIITKKPEKREFVVKAGVGSNALNSLSLTYGGKISEGLGLSANYGHKRSDVYIRDYVVKSASSGAGAIPVTGWQRTSTPYGSTAYLMGDKGERSWWQHNAGLKLAYDLTPTSKISVSASYHEHETDFEGYHSYLRDAAGDPVFSGDVEIDDGGPRHTRISEKSFLFGPNGETARRYSLGYEGALGGEARLQADAFLSESGYWYVSQFSSATKDGGAGKLADIPSEKAGASLQVSAPLTETHFLVAGLSTSRDTLDKKEYELGDWRDQDATGGLRYHAEGESQSYALFLQDEVYLKSALTLYLGARCDYWKTSGNIRQFVAPALDERYSTRSKSALSPKASLVYKPARGTVLRASAGRAFRAPTLSDMYSTWVGASGKVFQSNPDLDPEKTTSWELGVEHGLTPRTTFRATYYENYLTDLIYSTDLNPALNVKRNAGEAEVKGVELEIKHAVSPDVVAFANLTYNDAVITKNSAVPETVGKKITYTPERQLNLGIEKTRGAWRGSLIGRYVGDVYTNAENLDTVDDVYRSYDPYFVVDAKAAYQIAKRMSASVAVDNLLDRDYYQSSKAAGRTVFGQLRMEF